MSSISTDNSSHKSRLNSICLDAGGETNNFVSNYKKIYNNYSNLLKYYIKNGLIIEEIEKLKKIYTNIIKDCYKKLIILKKNYSDYLASLEKIYFKGDTSIYPSISRNLTDLNGILFFQVELFSKLVKNLEGKNMFDISEDNTYIGNQMKNADNFKNEEKKMEKLINEYDNDHQELMTKLCESEDSIKMFIVNKRNNTDLFTGAVKDGLNAEKDFKKKHKLFKSSNKNYFNSLAQKIEELKEKINNEANNFTLDINSFITIIIDSNKSYSENFKALYDKLNMSNKNGDTPKADEVVPQKEYIEEGKNINQDFDLFLKKYMYEYEKKYKKAKYKVKAIHETVFGEKIEKNKRGIISDLTSELGLEHCFSNSVILSEEDKYEVVKTFYGLFNFVNKKEYDLTVEKKKITVKNLVRKLLSFGFNRRKNVEPDLKPITGEEIGQLSNSFKTKDYRIEFFRVLNNFRALGIYEIPKREFDIISSYFKIIADIINGEKDMESAQFLIVLSQTFYVNKEGEKYYIQNDLIGHALFNNKNFWVEYIENNINESIKKMNVSEKDQEPDINIFYTIILPFGKSLKEFGMKQEMLKEIVQPLYNRFKLSEEMIKSIEEMIT